MSKPTSTDRELEAKFRVHAPFELPDLTGKATGVAIVDEPVSLELRAIYWDTSDLRLAREGVTLRHRAGEGPAADGWHLKIPLREPIGATNTASRQETHFAGDPDTVPDALRELVAAWVRTAVLGPVATLATQRQARILRDAEGKALVEVTDDLVSVVTAGHVAGRFREIEVEDRGGGLAVIGAIGDVLRAGGAVGGEFVPKVVRALGPLATADPDPPRPGPVDKGEPARCLLRNALRRDVRGLLAADVAVRHGEDDGVHQVRVRARRLRTTLKTFETLLDARWSTSLATELKWLTDSLAGARDGEVFVARVVADIDRISDDLVDAATRGRIISMLGTAFPDTDGQVTATMASERYVVLLERLVDGAWEPITSPRAEKPAAQVVPRLVRDVWQKLARDVAKLDESDATDAAWHRVRIDAKRVRYCCEAVEPAFGKRASRLAAHAEALQDVLGRHQDAAVAARVLHDLATVTRAGSVAFALGVLHADQQQAAREARACFQQMWARSAPPRERAWPNN